MEFNRSDIKNVIIIVLIFLCVNMGVYIYTRLDHQGTQTLITTSEPLRSQDASPDKQKTDLHTFDPNTADSAEFVQLGLQPRVARAIIHYRQAGGVFHKAEDFAKIYTLSDEDYLRLKPYIKIADTFATGSPRNRQSGQEGYYQREVRTSQSHTYSDKLQAGQTIELSNADTTMLKRIPGIGSYYARKITNYRERLGGFTNVKQLEEVGLPVDIREWVTLNPKVTNKLRVNTQTFSQLLKHPYLKYEQVKAIFNYRDHYGNLSSIDNLTNYDAFSAEDLTRLKPYLDFSH